METMKRWLDKDLGVHVVVGAVLVAAALGVEVVPELFASPKSAHATLFAGVSPARPLSLRPPLQAEPAPLALREEVAHPLGLDELLGILGGSVPAPVALRFTKAFDAQPVLRRAVEEFRREKGGKAPAMEFLQRLSRLSEFRQVVSQFRGEPGFQKAFLQIAKMPEVDGLLRGLGTSLKSGAALAGASVASGAKSAAAMKRFVSVAGRPGGRAAFPGGGPSLVATRGAGATNAAGAPSAAAAATLAFGAGSADGSAGGRVSGSAAGPKPAGQNDSDSLLKLATLDTVDRTKAASNFMSIFAAAPKWLRDALQRECDEKDICDPVQACQSAGIYQECASWCSSSPVCNGILPANPPGSSAGGAAASGTTVVAGADGTPTILRTDENGRVVIVVQPPNPGVCLPTGNNGDAAWATGGGLVGGAVGTVAGTLIGTAIGGPIGAVIGGAVGGMIGGAVGTIAGPAIHGIFKHFGF